VGRASFENYGRLVDQDVTSTEMSGRYVSQRISERLILFDVISKLSLKPTDKVLDIGCGVGLLGIPMSFLVERLTAIDHEKVLAVMRQRGGSDTIEFIAGDFMSVPLLGRTFSKIFTYGVVQNLEDEDALFLFIQKAVEALEPGGRFLIGDVSNVDKKARFQTSDFGKRFELEWEEMNGSSSGIDSTRMLPDDRRIEFNDCVVINLLSTLRHQGLDVFVLPQPEDLPWGRTREDILIVKPG